ncbi:MAG: SDR family NAD(P)-dependent oxidoreductase [Dehalococcoidales bacterium]|nr:SDR family NAD(P)-dependent oxidoreductase [Dehalococcoidales bacterium]
MKDFKDKVAFITGGASGAGLGQAKVFSEAGCKIVIADIRQDHLDEAKAYFKEKNVDIHTIKLDITDRKAYAAAADEVEKVFGGPPQLLFNTAGVNTFGPAEASTYEDFDWVMGVCLGGVVNGMITFVPRMIKSGRPGYIATTSSLGGFMGGATTAPYSAAKAAVNNLMESYSQALRPYNIGVSVLCPGNIKSNIAEAVYTRPKNLENTGYNVNEKTINFLRNIHAQGIDPIELAQILKKAIEDEQLYVLPFPNAEDMLRNIFDRVIDNCSPEGKIRQQEKMKKMMEEMAKNAPKDNPYQNSEDVGFAQARQDLGWVKPFRMPGAPPPPPKD